MTMIPSPPAARSSLTTQGRAGPPPAIRSSPGDERLAADIRRKLAEDAEVEGAEIGVSVADGIAELSGVARAYARAAAERVARSAAGVRTVRNLIEVPDPWALSDRDLRDIVLGSLAALPSVAAGEVTVTAGDRVVTISGITRSPGERDEIARIASEVEAELPAPVEIRNTVRPGDDGPTVAGIRARLDAAARQGEDFSRLSVSLSGVTAVLEGTLGRRESAERAVAAAAETPGLAAVDNRIRIRS